MTNPHLSASNGRDARWGSSLKLVAIAFIAQKPAKLNGVTAASLPPAKITSSRPICKCKRASPIAWVPVAHALTTLKFTPFAPTSIATTPEDIFARRFGIINGDTRLGPRSINARDCFSMVSIPPTPEPIRTPNLSGSTSPSLILASFRASFAAATAK